MSPVLLPAAIVIETARGRYRPGGRSGKFRGRTE